MPVTVRREGAFDTEVAIIGAGFSGMAIAIALDEAGIPDFTLLEKANDIGGTWRDNQYPGACCDVPSHLYSFSFEPNPDWTRRFSSAPEIHAYQRHVMHAYDLCDRTRGGFDVATARFESGGWNLESSSGETLRARHLVSAIGALHLPNIPRFEGLGDFRGKVMHSAEWDPEYDWTDRRVVVVGSAASAVQIVPKLAKTARRVSVLQRSANWYLPRKDRAISSFEQKMFRALPFTQRLFRWRQYLFNDIFFHANFRSGVSLRKWLAHHQARRHLARNVPDPELRARLTPDYPVGCKRVLLTDDFLPALQRENVDLVTDGIERFFENGLVTSNGDEIEADLVVMATGFQSEKLLGEVRVMGPGERTLDAAWANGIRAHRTVAVAGFPNFFLMYGPNSNLGHSSVILMIEAQARYLARILNQARNKRSHTIEVRPEAETAWNDRIQEALSRMVWSSECRSWYKDERGHIFTLWPHTTSRFIRQMRKAPLEEYDFS